MVIAYNNIHVSHTNVSMYIEQSQQSEGLSSVSNNYFEF